MPGIQDRINAVLATTQNLFTVLRDLFLALLLIVLLGFPAKFNSILSTAGITQVNGGVFTWQQAQQAAAQGTAAAQANSSASDTLDEVKSTLEQIASQSSDPAIQKLAADAAEQAGASIASINTANSSLAHSVLTLQTAPPGAPSSSQASVSGGWVLVGNADSSHQKWTKSTTPEISGASPNLSVGEEVTFSENVFLRADPAQGQAHDLAAILGAVRSGSKAEVAQVDYVPNKRGNAHVWVKVNLKSNP